LSVKSTFENDLIVTSIEFLNYGNMLSFEWLPSSDNKKSGFIKSNNVTLIGNIHFDPYNLWENDCLKSKIENSLLFDSWIKSFSLKMKNEELNALDIDLKLLKLFNQHWIEFNHGNNFFYSSVRFQIEKEQDKQVDDLKKIEKFSIIFPIKLNFKKPSIIKGNSNVEFPISQVHSSVYQKNLTIQNPSGSNLLVQIMFSNNYPQKEELFNLLDNEPDLFSANTQIVESLKKQTNKKISDDNSPQTAFSIHVPLTFTQFNFDHQKLVRLIENEYNVLPSKNSFVFLIPPNETRTIQVKFKPTKIGQFEDLIIIRNNLTVIETFTVKGESGTAELNINNMVPMRNSLFFEGLSSLSETTSTSDLSNVIIEMNKNDFENCDANMPEFTENDLKDDAINFKNYLKSLPDNESELIHEKKAYKTSFRSNSGILLRSFLVLKNVGTTDLNVFSVMFDGEPCFSRGIELVDCSPFIIETYPNNIYLLEVRYRPDFTMSLIRKSLTVATNIGDLEYLIEIKIPHNMLATCHDSLPRPVFEEYLYYIGTFLVILFVFIMLLTSMLESRSIIKYQYKMYRNLYLSTNSEEKIMIGQQLQQQLESDELFQSNKYETTVVIPPLPTTAQIISVNNKQRTKSSSTEIILNNTNNSISPPASPRVLKYTQSTTTENSLTHRNLAKSLSSPRSANNNVDTTVGLNSSPNTNKKALNPNITKKLKEKETESDSSLTATTTPIIAPTTPASSKIHSKSIVTKQISSPIVQNNLLENKLQDETDNKAKPFVFPKNNSKLKSTKSLGLNENLPETTIEVNTNTTPTSPNNKKMNKQNHVTQNDALAVQRRNYLNQQKIQKMNTKNTDNSNVKQPVVQLTRPSGDIENKKFNSYNNNNIHTNNNTINNIINNKNQTKFLNTNNYNNQSNLNTQDLDFLNNQFRRLQQQNHQQLKEIKQMNETTGTNNKTNNSPTMSTTNINSLQRNHQNFYQKKSQYDLINILLNSNKIEQEQSESCNYIY